MHLVIRPFALVAAALAAFLIPAPLASAQQEQETSVDLAPAMATDEENSYTFRTETKQTLVLGASPPAHRGSEVESVMRVKVRAVDENDVATVQFVYDRMLVRVSDPQAGEMEFDTNWPIARDAGNPLAPATRQLVGRAIIARIGPGGELLDMQGVSTEGVDPRIAQMMNELVNPESFKQLVKLLYGLKAEPSVASVGEPWTEESTLPSGMGSIQIKREYTLESVVAQKAYINIGGGIDLVVDPSMPQPPGAEHLEWKGGEVKGRIVWDAENGRLEKIDITTVIDTADNNPNYNGNSLNVTITSRSSLVRRV